MGDAILRCLAVFLSAEFQLPEMQTCKRVRIPRAFLLKRFMHLSFCSTWGLSTSLVGTPGVTYLSWHAVCRGSNTGSLIFCIAQQVLFAAQRADPEAGMCSDVC